MREGASEIEAVALVPAAPEEVFAHLSDLENHWRLLDRHVDVLELDGAPPDRLLLRLGGRAWLERRFAYGLGRLADRFSAEPTTPPLSQPRGEGSDPQSPSRPGPAYPSAGGSS